MSTESYVLESERKARDAEQAMLDHHDDDQWLLVREYWMWVDHNLFYELVSPVEDALQGFILAHQKHPDQGLQSVVNEQRYHVPVLRLKFYPQLTYLLLKRSQLQQLLQAREADHAQRRREQQLYFP